MAKNNPKENAEPEPTTESAPEIKSPISDAVANRINSGGMKADTVLEMGQILARTANAAEVMRLKAIVFDDIKKIDRMGKIYTEVRATVKDFQNKTGTVITASKSTKDYVEALRGAMAGLTPSQFNEMFKLDRAVGDTGSPCVTYE